jgi:hypothetical protein
MEAQVMQGSQIAGRRLAVPAVRWGAVFAGTVAGLASYMLLSLFGIAVGLTAIDPGAADPVGAVPIATGIWTGISMLISSFIGGYVAARMSGLARRADGMLHGFISWAATMVLFAWFATTALGNILGGTFSVLSQGAQTAGQAAGGQDISQRIESLITGGQGGDISPENIGQVRDYLSRGDRNGAVQYMTSQMGFTQERANQVADQMMPLVGPGSEQRRQDIAEGAVSTLSAASWWLFVGILLALVLGVWGGLVGARATSDRTLGDHSDERHYRTY